MVDSVGIAIDVRLPLRLFVAAMAVPHHTAAVVSYPDTNAAQQVAQLYRVVLLFVSRLSGSFSYSSTTGM